MPAHCCVCHTHLCTPLLLLHGAPLCLALQRSTPQGRDLPRPPKGDDSTAAGGVWVVGLSKGSEADRAGVEQGDELLQVCIINVLFVYLFVCLFVYSFVCLFRLWE